MSLINRSIKISFRFKSFFHVTRYVSIIKKIELAPDFPSIAGNPKQLVEISMDGVNRSLTELVKVCKIPKINIVDSKLLDSNDSFRFSQELKNLFDKEGSDKGTGHSYHTLYAEIIRSRKDLRVMEIGLGSNRLSTPSNMGINGRPGASLRVWSSLPNVFEVVGLDVDRKILFNEGKIRTQYLDQTDHASWHNFKKNFKGIQFDLIIDDGLHSPYANLVTISESIELLSMGGHLVVEDIPERSLPVWQIFLANKPDNVEASILRFRKAFLLHVVRVK